MKRLLARASRRVYSIGIVSGDSPLTLATPALHRNPVLTCCDVSDAFATTVADPFMIRSGGTWHMFFEALTVQRGSRIGRIALATSRDGLRWQYQRIVLSEPFHLSYPMVFESDSDHYMIPESHEAGGVRLYRADPFPDRWVLAKVLLHGPVFMDNSIFRHDGHWWMFTETSPTLQNDTLRLFHAPALRGPWREHRASPIVRADPRRARPAGRVISTGERLLRFAQDCGNLYGESVRAFEIKNLTVDHYEEAEIQRPLLVPGAEGWNKAGMHHVDAHPIDHPHWIACVDGWRSGLVRPGEVMRTVLRGR